MKSRCDNRHPVAAVFAVAAAASFVLGGYEFIRSVSSSLFIGAYGADKLPVVMALGPVGAALMVYAFGLLLSWLGPRHAMLVTMLLCAATIRIAYEFSDARLTAGFLYIFREAYIVVVIAQFWSLINSTLRDDQARRLNGPIIGIASLGAIAGGWLVKHLAERVGTEQLLLGAVASLLPAVALTALAYRWAGEPQPTPEEARGRQGHMGLGVLLRSRYLATLAGVVALTQVISTVLDLRFNGLVEIALPAKDARTAYLGGFFMWTNTAAMFMQFIAAPLLLRFVAVRHIHAGIPVVHFVAAIVLLIWPSLATGAAAFLIFKALDYSVFGAAKEMMYIPLSFDARYRAKPVIDAFIYRTAKGGMSLAVLVARALSGPLPGAVFPIIALVAAGAWAPLVWRVAREYETKRRA